MAKNQTHRAFASRPSYILSVGGELLDSESALGQLASEIRDVSAYATYVARNDSALGDELSRVGAAAPAEAGRQAGITMPGFLAYGRAGTSRKEKPAQYNAATAHRSWRERANAASGESSKHASRG